MRVAAIAGILLSFFFSFTSSVPNLRLRHKIDYHALLSSQNLKYQRKFLTNESYLQKYR